MPIIERVIRRSYGLERPVPAVSGVCLSSHKVGLRRSIVRCKSTSIVLFFLLAYNASWRFPLGKLGELAIKVSYRRL